MNGNNRIPIKEISLVTLFCLFFVVRMIDEFHKSKQSNANQVAIHCYKDIYKKNELLFGLSMTRNVNK